MSRTSPLPPEPSLLAFNCEGGLQGLLILLFERPDGQPFWPAAISPSVSERVGMRASRGAAAAICLSVATSVAGKLGAKVSSSSKNSTVDGVSTSFLRLGQPSETEFVDIADVCFSAHGGLAGWPGLVKAWRDELVLALGVEPCAEISCPEPRLARESISNAVPQIVANRQNRILRRDVDQLAFVSEWGPAARNKPLAV